MYMVQNHSGCYVKTKGTRIEPRRPVRNISEVSEVHENREVFQKFMRVEGGWD